MPEKWASLVWMVSLENSSEYAGETCGVMSRTCVLRRRGRHVEDVGRISGHWLGRAGGGGGWWWKRRRIEINCFLGSPGGLATCTAMELLGSGDRGDEHE